MSLDEQWKYERAYSIDTYKMGPARFDYAAADIATIESGKRYLDVGCGRGEMLDLARAQGALAHGIETVPQLCDGSTIIHGDACALPFPDDHFDCLSCYDVLEHLIPGEEVLALDEFLRVCKGTVFLSTNDRASCLPDGTDLHINKRPQTDWHHKITQRWADVVYNDAGPHRDWHWVCQR
jgi:ubiquinone/menaquinone biosynthesis C-methylase UbiE